MELSKCLRQVYRDHWVCLSQLFCLDLSICPAWLQNFMNPKQAEIIRTVVYLPSFSPLKTKTWPLIARKNLPQREFITLVMEKLFLWKNPTSNLVSPWSIIITFLRGKELGEKKKRKKRIKPQQNTKKSLIFPSKTIVACKINTSWTEIIFVLKKIVMHKFNIKPTHSPQIAKGTFPVQSELSCWLPHACFSLNQCSSILS